VGWANTCWLFRIENKPSWPEWVPLNPENKDSVEYTVIEERAAGPNADYDDPGNLRTTTAYYGAELLIEDQVLVWIYPRRVASITYPDGRKDSFTYERGTFLPGNAGTGTPGTFTDSADGKEIQATVVHGSTTNPGGIAGESTIEIIVYDAVDQELLREQYIYLGGTSKELIGWTEHFYDQRGRKTGSHSHDHRRSEAFWQDCCHQSSTTDESGIENTFEYDAIGRLTEMTKLGFGGSDDIETTISRSTNSAGYVETTTIAAGSLSQVTSVEYDLAGRVIKTVDAANMATTYEYGFSTGGGKKVTVTRPGGATEITEHYRDGRIKSVTGTAVVDTFYDYAVNQDGTQTTTITKGDNSPVWVETTTYDFLGRVKEVERPGYNGATVTTTYHYNDMGQLVRTETPGSADMLYEYDELGHMVRSGLDLPPVENTPVLDPESDDRINETVTTYEQDGSGHWWQVTTSLVYATANDDTATPVGVHKRRLTGHATDVVEQTISADINGNQTVTTVEVDRDNKEVTRTIDHPDSDPPNEESVTVNGLLTSSTTKTGLTYQYTYDALGRQKTITDPRTGTSETEYNSLGQVIWTDDAADKRTQFAYYPGGGLNAGRLMSITDSASKKQYFNYSLRGEQTHTWGETAYPVEYVYDDYGRRAQMRTFQAGTGWTGDTWPTGSTGNADVTLWTYDNDSGLLLSKTHGYQSDEEDTITYTYTAEGKLQTRTWARLVGQGPHPIVTTYVYDADTGELTDIQYRINGQADPATRDVSFTYNRLGQKATVTDAVGTRTFGYRASDLQLDTEDIVAGQNGLYSRLITRKYETTGTGTLAGRTAGFRIGSGSPYEYEVTYAYDAKGRFETITGTGLPSGGVVYERLKDNGTVVSELIEKYEYRDGSSNVPTVLRSYEPDRDLLTSVENQAGSPLATVSKYTYRNDALGRRQDVVYTGSAFAQNHLFKWGYNSRSELTTADRHQGTTPDSPGTQYTTQGAFDFAYDAIGNRGSFQLDGGTATTYTRNEVNQYEATANPTESFTYDDDGNLTTDGTIRYEWDAENRLIAMQSVITPIPEQSLRVEFSYDYMGRRVRMKLLGRWSGEWVHLAEEQYVYDDWNVVLVLDGNGTAIRKFTWGLDLSGTVHGAGGIGGLLSVVETGGSEAGPYWYFYDANGNVGQLVKSSDYSLAARYEYDPYGNLIGPDDDQDGDWQDDAGPYAYVNRIRFSTKMAEFYTDLYYYGYRYYCPKLGRWLSRDPTGEAGGPALYLFAESHPTDNIDPIGLMCWGSACVPSDPRTDPRLSCRIKDCIQCCQCGEGELGAEVVGIYDAYRCGQIARDAIRVTQSLTLLSPGRRNAFQHCYGQCLATIKLDSATAKACGDAHEACKHSTPGDEAADQHNNALGRAYGSLPGMTDTLCYSYCYNAAVNGDGTCNPPAHKAQIVGCGTPPPNPYWPASCGPAYPPTPPPTGPYDNY
jgi:RHS repeat-associated protein